MIVSDSPLRCVLCLLVLAQVIRCSIVHVQHGNMSFGSHLEASLFGDIYMPAFILDGCWQIMRAHISMLCLSGMHQGGEIAQVWVCTGLWSASVCVTEVFRSETCGEARDCTPLQVHDDG